MIRGIGVDTTELAATSERIARPGFVTKVYTTAEIAACRQARQPTACFAAHFALKEALMKALGAGVRQGLWFTQIEVRQALGERPTVTLHGRALERFRTSGAGAIHAAVTVATDTVVGMVVLE